RKHLETHLYHTGEFAQKAAITERTLRYYDKVGLLTPSGYTEAGYRLYTEADLLRLQQILALKFLGFSLDEVKACLRIGPTALQESLAQQKAMMQERREQLDTIIQAIDETEKLLRINQQGWDSIVHVIRVIQMTQNNDWRQKYLTDEQIKKMGEISQQAYTDEDRQKLAVWGKNWSEEDQRRASQQWSEVITELQRLSTSGEQPGSPAAQALAQRWSELIAQFTHGDPAISKGLGKWYDNLREMPVGDRPIPMPFDEQGGAFLKEAMRIYLEEQK
ncbi:MAG TPA: MerR family transcriptional regulator, partial [Ktedonobacteraceae bacterium]|nr:MerR family transcriptional regulator [Ktedonobacteraceae bacterium]